MSLYFFHDGTNYQHLKCLLEMHLQSGFPPKLERGTQNKLSYRHFLPFDV